MSGLFDFLKRKSEAVEEQTDKAQAAVVRVSDGLVTQEDPAIDIDNEGVRELSVPRAYQERPVSDKKNRVFELRYAAWGDRSAIVAAHGYAWQPGKPQPPLGAPNALGLAVELQQQPAASITVVFDSELGLAADSRFFDEMSNLRVTYGRSLVEITNFALSKEYKSRRAVAGLFHLIYLYSKQARQKEMMVVQAKQRHVVFYEKMLGFEVLAQQDSVVLLGLSFESMKRAIRQLAGTGKADRGQDLGLYPFFFPAKDEPGLLYRLLEHLGAGSQV
jgi:hypothetical protein